MQLVGGWDGGHIIIPSSQVFVTRLTSKTTILPFYLQLWNIPAFLLFEAIPAFWKPIMAISPQKIPCINVNKEHSSVGLCSTLQRNPLRSQWAYGLGQVQLQW